MKLKEGYKMYSASARVSVFEVVCVLRFSPSSFISSLL